MTPGTVMGISNLENAFFPLLVGAIALLVIFDYSSWYTPIRRATKVRLANQQFLVSASYEFWATLYHCTPYTLNIKDHTASCSSSNGSEQTISNRLTFVIRSIPLFDSIDNGKTPNLKNVGQAYSCGYCLGWQGESATSYSPLACSPSSVSS